MSVVQYYILKRFPAPYGKSHHYLDLQNQITVFLINFFFLFVAAAYFSLVATVAALAGQHILRRIITIVGRASIIIFILAFTIFVSAISLGKNLLLSLSHKKIHTYIYI